LLYYRKYKNKTNTEEKVFQVNWFGGEYRFSVDNGWSEWHKFD
jgi:hypothetical protein